jgi:hypothetical protein
MALGPSGQAVPVALASKINSEALDRIWIRRRSQVCDHRDLVTSHHYVQTSRNTRGRYARRVFNQPEGQASSPYEPPPREGQPAPPANPGQPSGPPNAPAYPTYQPPNAPAYPTYQPPNARDHSGDRLSGEVASDVGLVLTLVGLAVASLMWSFGVLLPLGPMLIVMTMVLLMAVVGAILVGRAIARRVHAILGLLAAGVAAAISLTFLLPMMLDPPWRDWWTCTYQADTVEQENACDAAYNTAN